MADREGQQLGNYRLMHLPALLIALIGREQEVAAVYALLQRPGVRLLTLTGTGGVGKTRLSLQVAIDLLDDFADGVCFVPLAPVGDPELVVATIAQALGINEAGERPLPNLLQAALQDKRLLLLPDNFEQAVAVAAGVADPLADGSGLKSLVASTGA